MTRLTLEQARELGIVFGETVKQSPERRAAQTVRMGGRSVKVMRGSFGLDVDARDECEVVEFKTPFPPSLNNLFANVPGVGRVKTKRYSDWIDESSWLLAQQKPGRISGRFSAEIILTRPDNRKRDLDGLAKGLLDLAVSRRVIRDDSLCQSLTLLWSDNGDGARVVLRKWEGAR